MLDYSKVVAEQHMPQSEPLPGQVADHAGGHWWALDRWKALDRFLVLGTEGGTYYVSERALTKDAAKAVQACIDEDAARVVARVIEISEAGRAPKNDPAIFVLALGSPRSSSSSGWWRTRGASLTRPTPG